MTTESFQIPIEAAELYESAFVPSFFAQWAPILCEVAGVSPGQSVLDVACGTGIVARTAADLVGADGSVVGIDLNEAMLTVARRVRPDIDWRQGDSAALPFADGSLDVSLCQMALMFFVDRHLALHEMARVVGDGGTVAVLVPSALDEQPAFQPFVELAARIAGPDAASLLERVLRVRRPRSAHRTRRLGRTHGDSRPLGDRHVRGAVGRSRRAHGGGEHAARRTPERRGVPAAPRRIRRHHGAVDRAGRQPRHTIHLQRRGRHQIAVVQSASRSCEAVAASTGRRSAIVSIRGSLLSPRSQRRYSCCTTTAVFHWANASYQPADETSSPVRSA